MDTVQFQSLLQCGILGLWGCLATSTLGLGFSGYCRGFDIDGPEKFLVVGDGGKGVHELCTAWTPCVEC